MQPWKAIIVAAIVAGVPAPVRADKAPASVDLAVDQVSVKGGPRLLGSVLGREADGTLAVAVGRAWLKKSHVRLFEQALRDETAETRLALVELRDRIAEWRKARAGRKELEFLFDKESERVENELKAIDAGTHRQDAPFMVLDLAPAKIERVVIQPPQKKSIAQAAWRENLADVETRSVTSLAQELKKQKIEPDDDPDALLQLLPPRRQNDAAWAARKALVEYRYLKTLDFQGQGDLLLPAGGAANQIDLGQVLTGVMKSGAGLFSELLDPDGVSGKRKPAANGSEKWLATAVETAEAEGVAGFRVTRVDPDLAAKRTSVETRFVARLPDGAWKTVWQRTETADASKPRPDAEQQIMQDPQVQAALKLAKSIGLGGDDQVKLAVGFGAATMEAQKAADSRFFEFRDRYLRQLDTPVMRVAPSGPAKAHKK
ncbi:MAG TPA: hypothetical protein VKU82_00545 [Planctomycetaceae bacterium]|nr:hypothetical protein [Planctomycetaceae bacterium]